MTPWTLRSLSLVSLTTLFLFAPPSRAEWKASGSVDATAEGLYWTGGNVGPDNKPFRGVGTLRLPATLRYKRWFRLRALPLAQWDPENPSKKEREYYDLQEGYMQLQGLPWTLQAGYNVQNWGDTDVFNPLDVVNARRYYDPFRSEKMGAPTLLVKHEWEKMFLEALWIPIQRETRVPGDESRWLPRDLYRSRTLGDTLGLGAPVNLTLPGTLTYRFQQHITQDNALKHNWGARAKFRFEGFDWTLAVFEGASTAPAVNIRSLRLLTAITPGQTNINITVDPNTPITLRAIYYRQRMAGTSFVKVLGNFLVKGASAHTAVISRLPGGQLPRDYWENALGIERTFSVGEGSLTALAQGTYVKRAEEADSNSVSLSRMFDRAAMAGLRWAPGEKLAVTGSVLYDTQFKGHFEHVDVSYKLADGWNAKLAGDILSGRPETPLGTYDRNDRVTFSLNVQK